MALFTLLLHFVLGSDLLTRCHLAKIESSHILYLKTELLYTKVNFVIESADLFTHLKTYYVENTIK